MEVNMKEIKEKLNVKVMRHPEIREGEIFLTNSTVKEYEKVGWKTKRMGYIALDVNGNIIDSTSGLFPVFLQKKEYDDYYKGKKRDNKYVME